MASLPPEDQPDTIDLGPVKGIPVQYEDDPRRHEESQAWSTARKKAQAMHSPDDLLRGLGDDDWRVRFEVVDRLIARGSGDPRTLLALLAAATSDSSSEVRECVLMRLHRFDAATVRPVLHAAANDEQPEVRWCARFSLNQLGEHWELEGGPE
ncbi:MAG: HEAT repeat domain-containing protein [Acidimicrobiales bacterium]